VSRRRLQTYAIPPLNGTFQPLGCDFVSIAAFLVAGAQYRIVGTGWSVSDTPTTGGDRHGIYRIGPDASALSEDLFVPTDLLVQRNTALPDGWGGIARFEPGLTNPWGVSSAAHQPIVWIDLEELLVGDPALMLLRQGTGTASRRELC
jgi:hypothetical protein